MKRVGRALQILSIILLLVGCSNNQDKEEPKDNDPQQTDSIVNSNLLGENNSNHVKRELSENLSIDANIVVPEVAINEPIHFIDGEFIFLDGTDVPNQLVDGKTIIDKSFNPSFTNSDYQSGSYTFSDNSTLQIGEHGIFFTTTFFDQLSPIFNRNKVDERYNEDIFRTSENLSFKTIEEVKKDIFSFLNSMSIEVSDEVTVFSLDYETMKNEEQKLLNMVDFKGNAYVPKSSWSIRDDSYFFEIRQKVNGITIASNEIGSGINPNYSLENSIEVNYSVDGIQYLSAKSIFKTNKIDDESLRLIDLDEAIGALVKKYDLVILTDPTIVTDVELTYLPMIDSTDNEKIQLRPIWQFSVKQVQTDEKDGQTSVYENLMYVFIDAVTGEEIY